LVSGLTLWVTGYRSRIQEMRKQETAFKMIDLEVRLNISELEQFKAELEKYVHDQEQKRMQKASFSGWSRRFGGLMSKANFQETSETQECAEPSGSSEKNNFLIANKIKNFRETIADKYPSLQNKAYLWGMPLLYGNLKDDRLLDLFRFYSLIENIGDLPVRVTSKYIITSQESSVEISSYDPIYEEEMALVKDYLALLERALKTGKDLFS